MAHLLPLPRPRLLVLNVGDSRAYLIRAGTITQLTRDHTLIEDYVRDGRLTPAQAARHPDRHVLTRAMGLGPVLDSDLFSFDLLSGDLIVALFRRPHQNVDRRGHFAHRETSPRQSLP